MSLCSECKTKICLKTKRPCPLIEKELDSMETGKLPHTISLDGNYFEKVIKTTKRGYEFRRDEQD